MIETENILGAFRDFLKDHRGFLSSDALNAHPAKGDQDDCGDPALAWMSPGALPDPKTGCIIGVIDDAIPFVHQRFTLPGNLSRMAAVWLQDARPRAGRTTDLPFGAEWRGAELSALLAADMGGEDAIYRHTGAVDMTRSATPSGAFETGHGAAVAPLAAGFDPSCRRARNHPVIAVCLPPRITADSTGALAPVPILAGILFIINRARRLCRFIERQGHGPAHLPVVINISLGLTAGSRDGSSLLERFMDAVSAQQVADLGPVHFVLPAGNHRQDRLRARLLPGQSVGWRLPPDDTTINAIEIWGPPQDDPPCGGLQITLTVPGLGPATTAFTKPGQCSILSGLDGIPLARAYYTPQQTRGGKWRDGIAVIATPTCPERLGDPFAPPGEWRVGIAKGLSGARHDLSVQRDAVIRGFRRGARQSWFHDPAYRSHDPSGFPIPSDDKNGGPSLVIRQDTINTYATGDWPLRAGAVCGQGNDAAIYTALLDADRLGGDIKPGDCMVPVDRARNSPGMIVCGRDSGSFTLASGTSLAAPQLTRWLARQLSEGKTPAGRAAIRRLAWNEKTLNQILPSTATPVIGLSARFKDY